MSNPVNLLQLLAVLCLLLEPVSAFQLSDFLEFFRYKYDKNCTYRNIKPDALITTNDSKGLVFFENKVWRTSFWAIEDPAYKLLESVYPQLNHSDSVDSVFTLLDRQRKLMYCFIVQDSNYFLYFTEQTVPSIQHDPFTNQVYLTQGDLRDLVHPRNYTNLFINPIFCAMTLPVSTNRFIFFFFNFYAKYLSCEASMQLKMLDPNKTGTLTNLYPAFALVRECEVFKQDQGHSNDNQECRFLAARPISSNSSGEQNIVLLGQRATVYRSYNLSHENFFKKMFKDRINYARLWDCHEISYRDYNAIKFIVLPTFLAFTISFLLFNSLLGGQKEMAKKRFNKTKRIHRMHQKIRADYLKRSCLAD